MIFEYSVYNACFTYVYTYNTYIWNQYVSQSPEAPSLAQLCSVPPASWRPAPGVPRNARPPAWPALPALPALPEPVEWDLRRWWLGDLGDLGVIYLCYIRTYM